jgi:hypothetical protein
MKTLIAKISFKKMWYNPYDFSPDPIYFIKDKSYEITNENSDRILINRGIFSKNSLFSIKYNMNYDEDYIYDHFYTEKEIRKLKILKLQNAKI